MAALWTAERMRREEDVRARERAVEKAKALVPETCPRCRRLLTNDYGKRVWIGAQGTGYALHWECYLHEIRGLGPDCPNCGEATRLGDWPGVGIRWSCTECGEDEGTWVPEEEI